MPTFGWFKIENIWHVCKRRVSIFKIFSGVVSFKVFYQLSWRLQNCFVEKTTLQGFINNCIIWSWFRIHLKSCKKVTDENYTLKMVETWSLSILFNADQNLCLVTFLVNFFATFLTDLESASKSSFLNNSTDFYTKLFFILLQLFRNTLYWYCIFCPLNSLFTTQPKKCDERTWRICLFHVVVNRT
jgi:hypothetical protein